MTVITPTPSRPPLQLEAARAEIMLYLDCLAGAEPPSSFLELRHRRPDGRMRQRFLPIADSCELVDVILALSPNADVYVGCAPRRESSGKKSAVERVWTLWADCDGPEARSRLWDFSPAPALVVRSGTGENQHAYWPLTEPLPPDDAKRANGRLARALRADPAATDAARILRPPATRNHKRRPPTPVTLEHFQRGRRRASEIVGHLPDPGPPPLPRQRARAALAHGDPLRTIPPDLYVHALTDLRVGPGRKIACPLHEDGTPSLHVYPTPEEGWYCFGCGRGGSVYDLAAALWRLEPRRDGFLEIRRRLSELLLAST